MASLTPRHRAKNDLALRTAQGHPWRATSSTSMSPRFRRAKSFLALGSELDSPYAQSVRKALIESASARQPMQGEAPRRKVMPMNHR